MCQDDDDDFDEDDDDDDDVQPMSSQVPDVVLELPSDSDSSRFN